MKRQMNLVLNYIESNIFEELSLELMSEEFFYSKTYLSRVFNKYVGISFSDYINKRRLSLIAIQLRNGNKSISYLANYYGYNSQKYFSNLFKKTFNVTPSEYKKGNIFITLQPKRIINGGIIMVINNLKDLCLELSSKVDNENTFLDKISEIQNIEIFDMSNSDVQLIGYFTENDETWIYEIDLNLINGMYTQKTIFIINNQKHLIKCIDKNEDGVYVILEDNILKKQIKAIFMQGSQPRVIMNTEIKNDLRVYGKHQDKLGYDKMMDVISEIKGRINKQTNFEEVLKLANTEEDFVLLRQFGSEFVFVKMLKEEGYFQLESIYVDMSKSITESYSFFSSYVDAHKIEMKNNGLTLEVYCDNILYGKSYIYGGDEITSSIFIKFPSGMSGSGGWDFSPEFK